LILAPPRHGQGNPDALRTRVRQDISAKALWELRAKTTDGERAGGAMITAGAGGRITGQGGHLVVIDDPHKNLEEALSKTFRNKIWGWYRGTLRDRLEPDAVVVCIMQRWHEDDLAGHLMKDSGEPWTVLSLPARAEANDPIGRAVGEPLCPARYDAASLEATRISMGDYLYAAKYQQTPKSPEGTLFKRSTFRYFRDPEGFYELLTPQGPKRVLKNQCFLYQTCDPAATEHDQSDYFVLQTWVLCPDGERLLYDEFREKAETVKHKAIMHSQYDRYKPALQRVEDKTFGLAINQECVREGLPVKPVKADTSKFARALPLEAQYTGGMIYHREGAPWLTEFEDELTAFPNGAHDDQVDAAAFAVLPFEEEARPDTSLIQASGQREMPRSSW
jgi:predicted phage terminase large subunit-like protein